MPNLINLRGCDWSKEMSIIVSDSFLLSDLRGDANEIPGLIAMDYNDPTLMNKLIIDLPSGDVVLSEIIKAELLNQEIDLTYHEGLGTPGRDLWTPHGFGLNFELLKFFKRRIGIRQSCDLSDPEEVYLYGPIIYFELRANFNAIQAILSMRYFLWHGSNAPDYRYWTEIESDPANIFQFENNIALEFEVVVYNQLNPDCAREQGEIFRTHAAGTRTVLLNSIYGRGPCEAPEFDPNKAEEYIIRPYYWGDEPLSPSLDLFGCTWSQQIFVKLDVNPTTEPLLLDEIPGVNFKDPVILMDPNFSQPDQVPANQFGMVRFEQEVGNNHIGTYLSDHIYNDFALETSLIYHGNGIWRNIPTNILGSDPNFSGLSKHSNKACSDRSTVDETVWVGPAIQLSLEPQPNGTVNIMLRYRYAIINDMNLFDQPDGVTRYFWCTASNCPPGQDNNSTSFNAIMDIPNTRWSTPNGSEYARIHSFQGIDILVANFNPNSPSFDCDNLSINLFRNSENSTYPDGYLQGELPVSSVLQNILGFGTCNYWSQDGGEPITVDVNRNPAFTLRGTVSDIGTIIIPEDCCPVKMIRTTVMEEAGIDTGLLHLNKGEDIWVSDTKIVMGASCIYALGLMVSRTDGKDRIRICNCDGNCYVEGALVTDPETGKDYFAGIFGTEAVTGCLFPPGLQNLGLGWGYELYPNFETSLIFKRRDFAPGDETPFVAFKAEIIGMPLPQHASDNLANQIIGNPYQMRHVNAGEFPFLDPGHAQHRMSGNISPVDLGSFLTTDTKTIWYHSNPKSFIMASRYINQAGPYQDPATSWYALQPSEYFPIPVNTESQMFYSVRFNLDLSPAHDKIILTGFLQAVLMIGRQKDFDWSPQIDITGGNFDVNCQGTGAATCDTQICQMGSPNGSLAQQGCKCFCLADNGGTMGFCINIGQRINSFARSDPPTEEEEYAGCLTDHPRYWREGAWWGTKAITIEKDWPVDDDIYTLERLQSVFGFGETSLNAWLSSLARANKFEIENTKTGPGAPTTAHPLKETITLEVSTTGPDPFPDSNDTSDTVLPIVGHIQVLDACLSDFVIPKFEIIDPAGWIENIKDRWGYIITPADAWSAQRHLPEVCNHIATLYNPFGQWTCPGPDTDLRANTFICQQLIEFENIKKDLLPQISEGSRLINIPLMTQCNCNENDPTGYDSVTGEWIFGYDGPWDEPNCNRPTQLMGWPPQDQWPQVQEGVLCDALGSQRFAYDLDPGGTFVIWPGGVTNSNSPIPPPTGEFLLGDGVCPTYGCWKLLGKGGYSQVVAPNYVACEDAPSESNPMCAGSGTQSDSCFSYRNNPSSYHQSGQWPRYWISIKPYLQIRIKIVNCTIRIRVFYGAKILRERDVWYKPTNEWGLARQWWPVTYNLPDLEVGDGFQSYLPLLGSDPHGDPRILYEAQASLTKIANTCANVDHYIDVTGSGNTARIWL